MNGIEITKGRPNCIRIAGLWKKVEIKQVIDKALKEKLHTLSTESILGLAGWLVSRNSGNLISHVVVENNGKVHDALRCN